MREIVKFDANVPQTVTLRYPTGKIVNGADGDRVMFSLAGEKVMFLDLGVAQKINELQPQAGETIGICRYVKGRTTDWNVWLTPATEVRRVQRMAAEQSESDLEAQLVGTLQNIQEGRPPAAPRPLPIPPAIAQRLDQPVELPATGTNGKAGASALTPAPAAIATESHHQVNGHNHHTGNGTAAPHKPVEPTAMQGWAQFLLSSTNALIDVFAAASAYSSAKHGNLVKPEDIRALMTTAYIAQTKNGVPYVS
jgi:hypothetical protein